MNGFAGVIPLAVAVWLLWLAHRTARAAPQGRRRRTFAMHAAPDEGAA